MESITFKKTEIPIEKVEEKQIIFLAADNFMRCRNSKKYHDYYETLDAIETQNIVITTQMCLLTTELFEKGFQVFVWDKSGAYEIKLGSDNERTTRDIRIAHNLFKLWQSGEFEGK